MVGILAFGGSLLGRWAVTELRGCSASQAEPEEAEMSLLTLPGHAPSGPLPASVPGPESVPPSGRCSWLVRTAPLHSLKQGSLRAGAHCRAEADSYAKIVVELAFPSCGACRLQL